MYRISEFLYMFSNFPHEKLQMSLVKYRGNSHKIPQAEHFRAL